MSLGGRIYHVRFETHRSWFQMVTVQCSKFSSFPKVSFEFFCVLKQHFLILYIYKQWWYCQLSSQCSSRRWSTGTCLTRHFTVPWCPMQTRSRHISVFQRWTRLCPTFLLRFSQWLLCCVQTSCWRFILWWWTGKCSHIHSKLFAAIPKCVLCQKKIHLALYGRSMCSRTRKYHSWLFTTYSILCQPKCVQQSKYKVRTKIWKIKKIELLRDSVFKQKHKLYTINAKPTEKNAHIK